MAARSALTWGRIAAFGFALACAVEASERAETEAGRNHREGFEEVFLNQAIEHNAMAIHMEHICVEQAGDERLRDACQQMIDAQAAEAEQMQAWLGEWYGISYTADMSAKAPRVAGAPDDQLMEQLIRHHHSAMDLGAECLKRSRRPQLAGLCKAIRDNRAHEIERLAGWL